MLQDGVVEFISASLNTKHDLTDPFNKLSSYFNIVKRYTRLTRYCIKIQLHRSLSMIAQIKFIAPQGLQVLRNG